MVNRTVVSDLGSLTDDDPHAVVDEESMPDLGSGMDLNTRTRPAYFGVPSGQSIEVDLVEEMTYAVKDQCVKSGIKEHDRKHAPRSRVALGNLFRIFPKPHVTSRFRTI